MSRVSAFVAAVILLSGCAIGPDYQRPDTPEPDTFRDAGFSRQSAALAKWWEVYQDPALQSLIRSALENNQDLAAAAARVEEAAAILGFTRADLYPSLNASGSIGRTEYDNVAREREERRGYSLSAVLSWELDIWGKFRRASEAARAEMAASEHFYRGARVSIVAAVAETYFLLLDLHNRLRIAEQTLASRAKSTSIIEARFEKGYVAQLDLFQAQVEEQSAAAAEQAFIREIRRAENALSVLLGQPPGGVALGISLHSRGNPPEIPPGLPPQLLERRPDILEAEELLHAQMARIGVAQALRLPSISLSAALGIETLSFSSLKLPRDQFWSIGGDLFGPLLSADRNVSRVEIEEARTKQLALSYERTVLQALREVEDALISVKTFELEHNARALQVEAGKSASRLSRARYDAGETSFLEVLDSERSLFRDELAESEALRNRFVSVVQLYKALGGGWETEDSAKTPGKPAQNSQGADSSVPTQPQPDQSNT